MHYFLWRLYCHLQQNTIRFILTFRNLASYIYRTGVKLPFRCPILYLFNKYPYWMFLTCCIISIFSSSKCHLFHNATLFGFCITHILNTGVLKFEEKPVAKRLNKLYYSFSAHKSCAKECPQDVFRDLFDLCVSLYEICITCGLGACVPRI